MANMPWGHGSHCAVCAHETSKWRIRIELQIPAPARTVILKFNGQNCDGNRGILDEVLATNPLCINTAGGTLKSTFRGSDCVATSSRFHRHDIWPSWRIIAREVNFYRRIQIWRVNGNH